AERQPRDRAATRGPPSRDGCPSRPIRHSPRRSAVALAQHLTRSGERRRATSAGEGAQAIARRATAFVKARWSVARLLFDQLDSPILGATVLAVIRGDRSKKTDAHRSQSNCV